MLAPETILQERYRVVRQLGQGGMGAVYEAMDERLHRTVALKETLVEHEELRRAFAREARLLANLNHPALPKVIDHFSEGTGQYLVMEFIAGADLAQQLTEQGRPFPVGTVLTWADELLDALEYLHALEPPVIHRDIKPANLKLTPKGHVVLLDFGLAKGTAGQMTRAQASQSVLGYTPNYAALEQIQGERTSPRSDLYSLAATLYHLLTGHAPIDALKRATEALHDEIDPLRPAHEVNADVSVALSNVLLRALALRPTLRPANATDLRAALAQARTGAGAAVTQADDEATRVRLPATITGAQTTQDLERDTMLMPPRADSRPAQPTTPPQHAGATVAAGAPHTRTGRRWSLIAAPVLVIMLLAIGFFAYQAYRAGLNAQQTAPATASPQPQTTQPAAAQVAPTTTQPIAQSTQTPPSASAPTPAATRTPAPAATPADKPRTEQQRTEQQQRAEQQRAQQPRAAETLVDAPDAPQINVPPGAAVMRLPAGRVQAELQSARAELNRARIKREAARRDFQAARQQFKAGVLDQTQYQAAEARVTAANQTLDAAAMRYEALRVAAQALAPNGAQVPVPGTDTPARPRRPRRILVRPRTP